jgi:hypothetical protein
MLKDGVGGPIDIPQGTNNEELTFVPFSLELEL